MIMMRIPRLRLNVHDGVMASVYFTLTGSQVPPKSDPTVEKLPAPKAILQVSCLKMGIFEKTLKIPFQKAEQDPEYHASLVLAIDVLGEFFFSRGALQRIMQYVADVSSIQNFPSVHPLLQHYLTAWSVEIRLSAVVSCCEMVLPFVAVYNKVTVDKRTGLLQTIYGVLRAMCSVLVNDSGAFFSENFPKNSENANCSNSQSLTPSEIPMFFRRSRASPSGQLHESYAPPMPFPPGPTRNARSSVHGPPRRETRNAKSLRDNAWPARRAQSGSRAAPTETDVARVHEPDDAERTDEIGVARG